MAGGTLIAHCVNYSHGMASFRRAGHDRVNAFRVDGTYLFTQYFEDEAVFAELTELIKVHQCDSR